MYIILFRDINGVDKLTIECANIKQGCELLQCTPDMFFKIKNKELKNSTLKSCFYEGIEIYRTDEKKINYKF